MELSIVIPCYNEELNVGPFYESIERTFASYTFEYEYIFVNDGSSDHTYEKLKTLTKTFSDANVNIVSFSRNFGKEAAMYAGLKESVGKYVVIIDADLQQDPKYVLQMLEYLEKDDELDSVVAFQEKRKESKMLTFFKSKFYRLINKLSEVDFKEGASDFRMFRREMVEAILSLTEKNRFSKGIFSWVGFKVLYLPYEVKNRQYGDSSWSFWKLFKYAIEGFISFTTIPLRIATFFGITFSFLAFLYLFIVIIQKIFFSIAIEGYATIICLILLIGGIVLFCIGIIGEYIAKSYIETKNRPLYIKRRQIDYKNKKKE